MEAHIDDVSLGTNTKEDHVLLLREFFIFCQENHLRIKLEKCEFMKEEMEYLGFNVGYGWWKPAAKKKIASSNCLGVPRPEGEIVLITDASDVGGGGTIYQWQELNPAAIIVLLD